MKLKSFSTSSRGFSIIELLVAFSVAVILTSVTIVGFSNYNGVQQLSQSAANVELLVNEARNNALSVVKTAKGDSSASCGTAHKLYAYKVTFPSTDYAEISQVCGDLTGSPADPLTTTAYKKITVPSGITISSTCTEILFESLDASTTITPGSDCSITLTRSSSETRVIKVDNNGNTAIQ